MIMWIAALVLVILCVVVGYRQGATRAAFSFVGLILAACLAFPFSPLFGWAFRLVGFKNQIVADFGGPILAFLVVSLAIKAIGQFVHRKIDYHYRYHRDDASRAVWEVMHRRVGACLGALNGTIYFVALALVVSVFGYFTIQTGAGENNSKVLSFLGKAALDLKETRMDKAVAPFNPASEKYFDVSDVAGLLYHNRGLVDRLYNYPVFAALAEEQAFKDLGRDKELQAQIKGQTSLNEIFENPKVQNVVSNTDIVTRVMELDFKDVKQYLETGVSPKYAAEKILGNWAYDLGTTLQLNRQLRSDVGAAMWLRMKVELTDRFDRCAFAAFYDNKAKLTLAANMEGKVTPLLPRPVAVPGRAGQYQTNFVPVWFTTNAIYSASGTWSGSAPNYTVTLTGKNGTLTSDAKLANNELALEFEGKALAFTRVND